MGPILMPQLIAILIPLFDVQGTLLLLTGIALNAVVCSLLFHPVQWYAKNKASNKIEENFLRITSPIHECDYCKMTKRRNPSIFSSQYLYNADNANATGYEIIDPGIPMLSLANDGWSSKLSLYGSRASLYSERTSRFGSRKPSSQNLTSLNRSSSVNLAAMAKEHKKRKISSNEHKIEEHPEDGSSGKNSQENVDASKRPMTPLTPKTPDIRINMDSPLEMKYINDHQTDGLTMGKLPFSRVTSPRRKISSTNNFNVEKEVLESVSEKLEEFVSTGDRVPTLTNLEGFCTCDEKLRMYLDPTLTDEHDNEVIEESKQSHSIWQKIVVFFDLDLLRDFTYINLVREKTTLFFLVQCNRILILIYLFFFRNHR